MTQQKAVTISRPNFQRASFRIRGVSPLVQAKFSKKMQNAMEETQRQGSTAKKNRKRDPKDFEALGEEAMHRSRQGWVGLHAGAIRNGMISACRTVGFTMTMAKLSLFVVADGFDADDGTPLIRIYGDHRLLVSHVRNASGVADLRPRPIWEEWSALVTLEWDADQFTATDVVNLLARMGRQVGVGEGRHFSRDSNGCGWGEFVVAPDDGEAAQAAE